MYSEPSSPVGLRCVRCELSRKKFHVWFLIMYCWQWIQAYKAACLGSDSCPYYGTLGHHWSLPLLAAYSSDLEAADIMIESWIHTWTIVYCKCQKGSQWPENKAKCYIFKSTWNCSAKPVMPFPGMVFLNRFTLTVRPVARMSVSPQVMSSSSASWMKMYWGCMCVMCEYDYMHFKLQLEREDLEVVTY